MYAIISDSGQQFKVAEGQELNIDYREAAAGDKITLGRVLVYGKDGDVKVGSPALEGASVTAEVIGVTMGPKLVVQKFRRRKTYRNKNGHRQMYTRVKISKIAL